MNKEHKIQRRIYIEKEERRIKKENSNLVYRFEKLKKIVHRMESQLQIKTIKKKKIKKSQSFNFKMRTKWFQIPA